MQRRLHLRKPSRSNKPVHQAQKKARVREDPGFFFWLQMCGKSRCFNSGPKGSTPRTEDYLKNDQGRSVLRAACLL
jgi:hypothetical protein